MFSCLLFQEVGHWCTVPLRGEPPAVSISLALSQYKPKLSLGQVNGNFPWFTAGWRIWPGPYIKLKLATAGGCRDDKSV